MADVDAAAQWEAAWDNEAAEAIALAERINAEEEATSAPNIPVNAVRVPSPLIIAADNVEEAGIVVERFFLKSDDEHPNNERFPLLYYRRVFHHARDGDGKQQ